MRMLTGLVMPATLGLSISAIAQQPAPIVRPVSVTSDGEPIADHIEIRFPLSPCGVGPWVVRVLELTHAPSGFESLPGCEELPLPARPKLPGPPDLDLFGMTPIEALDRLLQVDSRYRRLDDDGVIVVRPAAAWEDIKHFMHQPVEALRFTDNNYLGALQAFQFIVFQPAWHPEPDAWRRASTRTPEGGRLFSVNIAAPTGLIAADAIVRAHGALRWSLRYCRPEPRLEFAWFSLTALAAYTTGPRDGGGFHMAMLDTNGKPYDPCAGAARESTPRPR